jgi:glycoprotein endo-alpha-1,2-mannosidase
MKKAGRTTLVLWIAVTICAALLAPTDADAGTGHGRELTGTGGELAPSTASPLLGAYYSDWFPGNSTQGTLRQHLVPSQGADPTLVNSSAPSVAYRAIAQASKAGISFFALDYWPSRPTQNKNIRAFVRAKNLRDIRFCLLYETWDLGFDAAHEATPVTPSLELKFDRQLLQFARTYFANPRYLRIQGRPVLVLYLTRTLTGDVGGMIAQARHLLRQHGYNPYLIGDEVFWRVTQESPPAAGSDFTKSPQLSRIEQFNAITSYSLYGGGSGNAWVPSRDFVGYPGTTSIVRDEVSLYRRYSTATDGRVPVIPDVSPGANTRGVRLSVNEPAEPRQWRAGESAGSTLTQFLRTVARPVLDPRLPMVFVTSWNEWNEDTGIQPVGGVPTPRDDSPTGTAYTQGYTYGGEGNVDLTVIRNFEAVAWGRVTEPKGGPAAQVHVTASHDGRVVSRALTNSAGWYVMPRTKGGSGVLLLRAAGRSELIHSSTSIAQRSDFRV